MSLSLNAQLFQTPGVAFNSFNRADTNNKLSDLLPAIFQCISSGAYYGVKVTIKYMNEITIQNAKCTYHTDILHIHCTHQGKLKWTTNIVPPWYLK